MTETIRELDTEALALFARKGKEGGPGVPQAGEANAVKVRRVVQVTQDLAPLPFSDLRILDLGCGEGVYAVEAGLRGAQVLAVDARTQRMDAGAACAARHGLDNVTFRQEDVRRVRRETHGEFDAVFCLGILYHLDATDVFTLLENVHQLCRSVTVIDTLITLEPDVEVTHRERSYEGERYREHADDDSEEVRRSRVLKSLDNTYSFKFTKASLVRALSDIGFSSVFECHAPPEPGKASDRVSLVACRGRRVAISTYPWVNDRSEKEIEDRLAALGGGAR
jgi:SAM-dependent methyltransferase